MIRPLRRAHGVSSLLLAMAVIATLAAAIGFRGAWPVTPSQSLEERP